LRTNERASEKKKERGQVVREEARGKESKAEERRDVKRVERGHVARGSFKRKRPASSCR